MVFVENVTRMLYFPGSRMSEDVRRFYTSGTVWLDMKFENRTLPCDFVNIIHWLLVLTIGKKSEVKVIFFFFFLLGKNLFFQPKCLRNSFFVLEAP